jgi:phage shock protein PspC (stress-responsive transcriptional regulator)
MSSTAPPPEQREAAFFTAIRGWGITRGHKKVLGGVARGLGERISLAPIPSRMLVIIAGIVFTGLALLAYAAAWALLPDKDCNIVLQNFGRGITNVGALIGIAVMTLIGLLTARDVWWLSGFGIGRDSGSMGYIGNNSILSLIAGFLVVGFALLIVGGLVFAIVYASRRSRSSGPLGAPAMPTNPDERADEDPATASADATVADASTSHSATAPAGTPGQPQPWEAALLPGDPALAGTVHHASGASAAWGGGYGGPQYVPQAPAAPKPRLPKVPGPGRRFYLITAAWVFLSAAIIGVTESIDRLAVAPGLAWLALFTVGFGLILAGIAVAGRKLGFLGFLSVPLLVVGLLASVNSGEIDEAYQAAADSFDGGPNDYWIGETHYDSYGNVIDEYGNVEPSGQPFEPTEPQILADPTLVFADDYEQISIAPQCYDTAEMDQDYWYGTDAAMVFGDDAEGTSRARLTFPQFTADSTVDIIAAQTVLTIPQGTNVIVRADPDSQSYVYWQARNLYCEFWDGGQDNVTLLNPGAPTLTLVVHNDEFSNAIEIHETPAAEPEGAAVTSTPEPTPSPDTADTTTEGDQS